MRKLKELDGLPILAFDVGKKIGEVKDTLFSPEQRRVLAFLIDEGGWFEQAKVIPYDAARGIGSDAIIVPDAGVITTVSQNPDIKKAFDSRRVITNMKVYSEDGRYLGTIDDVFIDETTGEVKGYEVTGGFMQEIMKGKYFMPAPATLKVGEQVVFVPADVATKMEQQVRGGVQKQIEQARQAGATYVGEAKEWTETAQQKAVVSATQQQKKFVVGKTSQSEVRAPDGTIIVMPGQTITPEMADEADKKGVLGGLVAAVGGAEAHSLLTRVQEELSRAYEEARRTVTGAAERGREQAERTRIENTLGRPVTRVILDQNDKVILNTGEIVTHEAIRRAREAGVLDMLLNSVSFETPSIGYEQRRAPVPGEASLKEEHRTQTQ